VLPQLARKHTVQVFSVPPLYEHQSSTQAARRYLASFGVTATLQPRTRVLRAKLVGQSIASICRREGVAYRLLSDVNAPEFLDQLRQEKAELLISVSCPQIFRRALIELPPRGILNIHGAILPQYRGVMHSFWMMANGERQAGVSIYFVNEKIDAGELCAQKCLFIDPKETLDKFILRSKLTSAGLLLRTIDALEGGTIERRPLDVAAGSYFSWPDATAVRRFRACGRRLL
jgi:methionyl-tRNA formyltransferase